jgi:hypothetical protein
MALKGDITILEFPGVVFNYHRISRVHWVDGQHVQLFVRHYVNEEFRVREKVENTAGNYLPHGWITEGIYTLQASIVPDLWAEDSPMASTLYAALMANEEKFKACEKA